MFTPRIAVIGLGYVGLPVAIAFAEHFPGTIGFDIDADRIGALKAGVDRTGGFTCDILMSTRLTFTSRPADLVGPNIYIVCVPTPILDDHRPDLRPLQSASEIVGRVLSKGGVVVYESTVYPGLTEEFCGPILARESGLHPGDDFSLGYSPERINPGDNEHTFENIVKVVAANDEPTANLLALLYGTVVKAGVYLAPNIKVAEAAKVLENTQRDLNIALMNELAIICDRLEIRTKDVLDAAKTKWNFLPFTPGLVGGHCIGVDPYYLTSKAQTLGYHPEVILAGRRINDSMGVHLARRMVRFLGPQDRPLSAARVAILGFTFKENVPDIRNSKVPDIVAELGAYGIKALLHDPLASAEEVMGEYGLNLSKLSALTDCDGIILASPHAEYLHNLESLWLMARDGAIVIDVKSALNPRDVPQRLRYWSL